MTTSLHYSISECGEFHIPFPSEAAMDLAMEWYNATPKQTQIKYCAERGFNLLADEKTLLPDWATLSMMVRAWNEAGDLPEAHAMLSGVMNEARH